MKELTILEALCILRVGWSSEDEKKLSDKAYNTIKLESKRLRLIYQKELIENQLEQFKKT
jgi:hypothetical protein